VFQDRAETDLGESIVGQRSQADQVFGIGGHGVTFVGKAP